jgi:hypothetical protein
VVEIALTNGSLNCTSALITLASERFEDLVAFYSALLEQGAEPYQRNRYAEFQLPGLRLAIFKPRPDQADRFNAPTSGAMSLCLEVVDLTAAIATPHRSRLSAPWSCADGLPRARSLRL